MSIHPSLRPKKAGASKRSVLTRHERILRLAEAGKFSLGEDSVFGLPKLRVYVAKKRKKGGGKKKGEAK